MNFSGDGENVKACQAYKSLLAANVDLGPWLRKRTGRLMFCAAAPERIAHFAIHGSLYRIFGIDTAAHTGIKWREFPKSSLCQMVTEGALL